MYFDGAVILCKLTPMTQPIYLDYNATTPLDPGVLEAMLPFFTTHFGNAASKTHQYGWAAEEAVKIARESVAELMRVNESGLDFLENRTYFCIFKEN